MTLCTPKYPRTLKSIQDQLLGEKNKIIKNRKIQQDASSQFTALDYNEDLSGASPESVIVFIRDRRGEIGEEAEESEGSDRSQLPSDPCGHLLLRFAQRHIVLFLYDRHDPIQETNQSIKKPEKDGFFFYKKNQEMAIERNLEIGGGGWGEAHRLCSEGEAGGGYERNGQRLLRNGAKSLTRSKSWFNSIGWGVGLPGNFCCGGSDRCS